MVKVGPHGQSGRKKCLASLFVRKPESWVVCSAVVWNCTHSPPRCPAGMCRAPTYAPFLHRLSFFTQVQIRQYKPFPCKIERIFKKKNFDCFSTYKYLLNSSEIPSSPTALHEAYPSLQWAQWTSADLHYLKPWAFVHEWNMHYFFNNTEIISIILNSPLTWSAWFDFPSLLPAILTWSQRSMNDSGFSEESDCHW